MNQQLWASTEAQEVAVGLGLCLPASLPVLGLSFPTCIMEPPIYTWTLQRPKNPSLNTALRTMHVGRSQRMPAQLLATSPAPQLLEVEVI